MSAIAAGRREAPDRPLSPGDGAGAERLDELFGQAIRRVETELPPLLLVLVDRAAVDAGELRRERDDPAEDGLEVEGGADRLAHLGQRPELPHRPAELVRPLLQLPEQAHVLDGDDGLVR